jgi:DNA-binding NarL/FixJ family response regulator
MRERRVVHVVEPQVLFVPTLLDVFEEAGFGVDRVEDEIRPETLLDEQPDVVFLDVDYLADPLRSVRLAHVLAPAATIFVYGGVQGRRAREAFIAAGASLVLEKSAERSLIVAALRSV